MGFEACVEDNNNSQNIHVFVSSSRDPISCITDADSIKIPMPRYTSPVLVFPTQILYLQYKLICSVQQNLTLCTATLVFEPRYTSIVLVFPTQNTTIMSLLLQCKLPRGDAGGLSREYVLRIPSVS